MPFIYRARFFVLTVIFLFNLTLIWPGLMQPDSCTQYAQAVAGQYTDHHPPMMSFIWHYLDKIHQGEGLMFGLQLTLLYSAVAILLLTIDKMFKENAKLIPTLVLLALPLYPQILIYSKYIVKDVHYAFSFFFAAAVLIYYTISMKKPAWWATAVLFSAMVYGAAVKYQGQFCVAVLAVWLGCLLCLQGKLWHKIAVGLAIYTLIFATICAVNSILVPVKSKNHSWQYVKLYDLAAISRQVHQDLIPDANKLPAYTFEKLEQRFKYPTVDPYIFSQDNIFTINADPIKAKILYSTWLNAVLKHPVAYFMHRGINMCYALLSRPGFDYVVEFLENLPGDGIFYASVEIGLGALFYALMSHFPVIIIGCGYFVLAIRSWKYSNVAPVLLGLSSISLLMVGILFFMSMAGVPRYTYISILLVHAAHIFAYKCLIDTELSNHYNSIIQLISVNYAK